MVKSFCDVCKNELTRNVVSDPLVVEQGDFKAEVKVNPVNADLCLDCLMKMLNAKPKRKYVRKEAETVIEQTIQ